MKIIIPLFFAILLAGCFSPSPRPAVPASPTITPAATVITSSEMLRAAEEERRRHANRINANRQR